jgi:hypothetical protein
MLSNPRCFVVVGKCVVVGLLHPWKRIFRCVTPLCRAPGGISLFPALSFPSSLSLYAYAYACQNLLRTQRAFASKRMTFHLLSVIVRSYRIMSSTLARCKDAQTEEEVEDASYTRSEIFQRHDQKEKENNDYDHFKHMKFSILLRLASLETLDKKKRNQAHRGYIVHEEDDDGKTATRHVKTCGGGSSSSSSSSSYLNLKDDTDASSFVRMRSM